MTYRWVLGVGPVILLLSCLGYVGTVSVSGAGGSVDPQAWRDTAVAAQQGLVAPSGPSDPEAAEAPCAGGSHEGCYGHEDMQVYLDRMIALVEPMFDDAYGAAGIPTTIWYVPSGDVGGGVCGPFDSAAFFYCPLDQSIYIGQDELWYFYSELGDAAPAVGLAHEWGHHIQTVMGVPRGEGSAEWVMHENQADCISGAWLSYADQEGFLEYPDDVEDVDGVLRLIAAAEDDPHRVHGTLEERTASLAQGYADGLGGCNDYFPETPVYPDP
jgi:hypothetical protein